MALIGELRTRLSVRPLRRRVRDLAIGPIELDDIATFREDLARRYLSGEGIEIGPMHRPVRLPASARVRYVDMLTREQLLSTHAGAYGDPRWVPAVDVIDDAETLSAFQDGTLDFVIANHTLEHTEDPVLTLRNFMRVLRAGGILYLTLPDARRTFDRARPRTTIEHLRQDHEMGPGASRREHYAEWARHIEGVPPAAVEVRVAEFEAERARHHFHVWELETFLGFLAGLELPVSIQLVQAHGEEFAVILRREADA